MKSWKRLFAAKKPWKRMLADKWVSSAVILLGVLALGGAVAMYVTRNAAADHAAQTHHSVDTTNLAETVQKKGSPPLKIGSIARIGSDYSVTVTKVSVYEDTDTQYLGAVLKATYLGKESGDPRNDLTAKFTPASDSSTKTPAIGESECKGDLGEPDLSDLNGSHSLPNGGSKTYVVCISLPTSKVDDGKVSIETSAANHRAFWTTDGAETKKAPPPKPKVVLAAPAAKATVDPDTIHDLKKNIKKAKKARDVLDKQIKAYKKLPDHKKKKLKKFEKEREKLDDAIDDMEKVRDQLDP